MASESNTETSAERQKRISEKLAKNAESRTNTIGTIVTIVVIGVAFLIIGGAFFASKSQKSGADYPGPPPGAEAGAIVVGAADAPVKVTVFEDFQCPYCVDYERALAAPLKLLVDEGQVQMRYNLLAFVNATGSPKAANAAFCAASQGKFAEYHDALFKATAPQGAYTNQDLLTVGESVGLNNGEFEECVAKGTYLPFLEETQAAATEAQVNATPTFFVNGKPVSGSTDTPASPSEVLEAITAAVAKADVKQSQG